MRAFSSRKVLNVDIFRTHGTISALAKLHICLQMWTFKQCRIENPYSVDKVAFQRQISRRPSNRHFLRNWNSWPLKLLPRRTLLHLLLAAAAAWICWLLLISVLLLQSCGSISVASAGQCNKKARVFPFLDALGFIPKPIHRCQIPLLKNPYLVKIPTKQYDEGMIQSLTYIENDEVVEDDSKLVALFGGYQTWQQREESFVLRPHMKMHCGFVGNSGADIDVHDRYFLRKCQYVVASGIFDGYDMPHQPSNVSESSKETFCFVLMVDQKSLTSITSSVNVTEDKDGGKWAGIWRLVVLHNLPYDEPRRNGKVPKLLTHRIFPEAQYSIWIDGKMELVVDPLLILERYLWRGGHSFAIAQHKHHRSIFEEADANKRRKRYARPLIDKHMEQYRQEGMEPWSRKKLPYIPSDVPEGAIIIRKHTPFTNLFCCLWFNEVNRFTPRDQLSFGYVVYRLNGSFPFWMFPNCEYNALFILHKHTREHSSKVEWVKSLDELYDKGVMLESRGGIGLFTPTVNINANNPNRTGL